MTTLSGGDITHAVPDNTGYITEGQLFLRNDSDTGKVIVDPFRSLSRLKQLVIGKKTREDHPQVMNACVRLYADAANAKTKLENGFDLSDYDERALKFAHDYSEKLLSIDINIDIDQMLDTAWRLFAEYFTKTEVAIKFQYNKTSLGDLGKQLKMRQKALPTIKSKESALRSEVKKAKEAAQEFRSQLSRLEAEYDYMVSLWGEFDCDLLRIADIELTEQKIAGVRTPVLREIVYEEKPYDLFSSPVWYAAGIDLLKRLSKLGIEYELFNRKMELLDFARRKTTQKVNLYEKVQIPGYEDAIRKIKRFLEDEENLSKSAQKIVKTKQQQAGEGQMS